jgi:hypothetical protein
MAVDESRHHDHPAGVDHLDLAVRQTLPDAHDPVPLYEDVAGGEVADAGIEAEHGPTPDQLAIGGHDAEVRSRRVERRDLGLLRGPAADHEAPGPLVVSFHQLLEVACLEEDDPDQDQDADDHRPVLR